MNEKNDCGLSAPVVRYYGQRRISKKSELWIPPSLMRGRRDISMTYLADGTIVLGRPYLFPDIPALRWRDYCDLMTPEVIDRNGCPLPEPDFTDYDEDQLEMFDENGRLNVYFADEDNYNENDKENDNEYEEDGPDNENTACGKDTDMKKNDKETGKDFKTLMRTMAESLRGAVESIESCIALMAAFTENQTP